MSLVDKDDRAHSVSVRMAYRGRHKSKPSHQDRKVGIEERRAFRGLVAFQTDGATEDARPDGVETDVQRALLDEWADRARKHDGLQTEREAEVPLQELIVGPTKTKKRAATREIDLTEFEVLDAPSAARVRALDDARGIDGPEPQEEWDYIDDTERDESAGKDKAKVSYAEVVVQGLG